MEIESDQGSREFVVEADLRTNGVFDVVVESAGVTCDSDPGGTDDPNGGWNNDPNPSTGYGELGVWTAYDHGCGTITVSVAGHGQQSLTRYQPTGAVQCGDPDIATSTNLTSGNYSVSAICQGQG